MIKALIFDVDGTLAETEELHRASFNKTFSEFALDWHWDEQTYSRLLATTGGKERIFRYVAELGLPTLHATMVQEMHRSKNSHYAKAVVSGGLTLRPGVEQLIAAANARGLKLGIATTTSRSNVMALISGCFPNNFRKLFQVMVCGEDVSDKKPNPEVYNLCLQQMKIAADEAIAFEDSPAGLAAALAANIATILTPSAYTRNEIFKGARVVLPDLKCNLDWLLELVQGR